MACNIPDRLVADTTRGSPRRSTSGSKTFHIDDSRREACSNPWISASSSPSLAEVKAFCCARYPSTAASTEASPQVVSPTVNTAVVMIQT
jgi:hypothetical protein